MNKSVVYVDSVLSATKESGDVIKSGATIYAEIGEIVLGSKKAEKTQRTVFKSLGLFHFLSGFILLCCNTLRIFFMAIGLALEDAVSARLVYDVVSQK